MQIITWYGTHSDFGTFLSYQFHEKYLSRGLAGGQAAADQFMEKVREHLVSLGTAIHDPKSVPVVVKAYAHLNGIAQACVRDRKLTFVGEMSQFWIGFTQRYPLVDFVDVGLGKEEADNKLKSKLACVLRATEKIADTDRGAELSHWQSAM